MMMDLLGALADRGCLHIIFRILASLDSWDLQVDIMILVVVVHLSQIIAQLTPIYINLKFIFLGIGLCLNLYFQAAGFV